MKFIGFGIGSLVAVWGASIAWQRVQVMQDGNVTDRFTRAVDQLGSVKHNKEGEVIPNREIRIGAVYALGEIIKESPKYFVPIMEILSAYIRKNAQWDFDSYMKEKEDEEVHGVDIHDPYYKFNTDPVVESILKVIGSIERPNNDEAIRYLIDLSEAELRGYTRGFSMCDFYRVLFNASSLRGSSFASTNFKECEFISSDMRDTKSMNTVYRNCTLNNANFANADLEFVCDFDKKYLDVIQVNSRTKFRGDLQELVDKKY